MWTGYQTNGDMMKSDLHQQFKGRAWTCSNNLTFLVGQTLFQAHGDSRPWEDAVMTHGDTEEDNMHCS